MLAALQLGLRVAPRAPGLNAAPWARLHRTILLRADRIGEISIDPLTRIARVGRRGALGAGDRRGLATRPDGLAGSAADVGVVRLHARRRGVVSFARSFPQWRPTGS